ncbi:salicylate hydroxylase [Mycena olivaceomarginata]|nr:salicylate hydroxylase [Mycena olivaceomarginata]
MTHLGRTAAAYSAPVLLSKISPNTDVQVVNFRVAIVGGGMCGLACAVGLAHRGIRADVFEAAPKFDEVGAGVGLGSNALRALKGLGVLDAVLARSDEAQQTARRMLYLSGVGAHEQVYDYETSSVFTTADNGIGIYRPAFLAAVLPLLPDSSATHFNKRCTSISTTASGSQCIHFADGTTHEADLVIGADGIKSISRNALVDPAKRPLQFTNTVAYRGLVTGPWAEVVPQQELLDSFDGWGHDHMKSPGKWCIHALTPLDTFVRGKIALVGDAAHAMTPHLGSGVGQGFEDVFVLCELLGHSSTNLSNLEPRANMVLKESFRAGVIYENFGKAGYDTGADIEGHLAGIWEPIWRHNLDGDVAAAIASLQEQGSFPAVTTRF